MNNARRLLNMASVLNGEDLNVLFDEFAPHVSFKASISDVHTIIAMHDGSLVLLNSSLNATFVSDDPVQTVFALYDVWRTRPESHAWFDDREDQLAAMFRNADANPGGIVGAMADDMYRIMVENTSA